MVTTAPTPIALREGDGHGRAHPNMLFEYALQSLGEGMILFDPQQTVVFANTRAQSLLGLPPETLRGLNVRALWACPGLKGEVTEETLQQFNHALDSIETCPVLTLSRRTLRRPTRWPAGQAAPGRDISLRFFPVCDDTGSRLGGGLILRDITAEQELARRKDELVNMVTHELRTPLTNILCFSDLLLTRDFPEARRRQMLETIHHETKRLSTLISDFLNLRRLESGRQALALSDVRLAEVAASVAAGFALSQSKHILEFALPPDLPPIRADQERLGQALRNLLDNAFKYSPQGGFVTIAAREAGGELLVTVSDQGLGLPSEVIPRLFQRFYRVDSADRRDINGTGLGLAIVKEIISAHGGRVWAESPGPGQGSTFGFALPLTAPPAPQARPLRQGESK